MNLFRSSMMAIFLFAVVCAPREIVAQEPTASPPAVTATAQQWEELAAEIAEMKAMLQAQQPQQSIAPLLSDVAISLPGGIDQAPDGLHKQKVIWWVSVGTEGLGTYLKWSSAWKQPALDPIHAEPSGPYQGKYYTRATVFDWAIYAGPKVAQYFLGRAYPELWSKFSIVNFGMAGASFAQFGYNSTLH